MILSKVRIANRHAQIGMAKRAPDVVEISTLYAKVRRVSVAQTVEAEVFDIGIAADP
jgi:hypothetical protein